MRQLILPVLLVTTATLSLSDVLPIITVNEAESEPTIDDQTYDNTVNNIQDRNNPNIFYEFLIGSSKNDKTKIQQRPASKKFNKKDISDLLYNEDNYDDEGYRKKQWHNYPRQLDRLHSNSHSSQRIKKNNLEFEDTEKLKRTEDSVNDIYQYNDEKIDSNDIDAVAVPLLILKIRLAFLNNDLPEINLNSNEYTDLVPVIRTNSKYHRKDDNLYTNKIDNALIDKSERQKRYKPKSTNLERDNNENKPVSKRIFSLWSRLQSLSHKGHELQHRRHLYAFYGLPDDAGSGTLTAETRAIIRPPGSPLRWG